MCNTLNVAVPGRKWMDFVSQISRLGLFSCGIVLVLYYFSWLLRYDGLKTVKKFEMQQSVGFYKLGHT